MALGWALGGCATQSDLNDQARKLQGMIAEQSRSIEGLRKDVERLSADLGETKRKPGGTTRSPGSRAADKERVNALDKRLREAPHPAGSEQLGMTLSPEGMSTEEPATPDPAAAGSAAPPPPDGARVAATPPADAPPRGEPPPAPAALGTPEAVDPDWKREVAQDRAVASATDAPERAEYLGALDGLARGDCSKAGPRLYAISTGPKSSPLSDDVLYWEARCLEQRGDSRQALSKLREIVHRYPRGDKAPAALWEEGKLLIRAGDASGARLALSRLTHDYPATAEATQARRKLADIDR
jgi:TolA-binding protein